MSEQGNGGSDEELRYDPNQDPEEKRKIRERYRTQLRNLEGKGELLSSASQALNTKTFLDKAKDFKSLGIKDLLAGVQRADESFGTGKFFLVPGFRAPQMTKNPDDS